MTYYVDATTGDDDDDGLTEETAWQTIGKVNGAIFWPGDSILFKRGETWTGTRLVVPASGSNGSPITFGTYGSGALPILQGDAAGCFRIADKEYITVEDLDASGVNTDPSVAAVQVKDSSHIILDGVTGRDAAGDGFYIEKDTGTVDDILVQDCVAYDNAVFGISAQRFVADGPTDVRVIGCSTYSNGTDSAAHHGIYLRECIDSLVQENISYSNVGSGIKINTCTNTIVERNASYNNGGAGICDDGVRVHTGGTTIRNNLLYGNFTNIQILDDINGDYWYHNTLVNATDSGFNAFGTNNTGHVFKNNIILQDGNVVGIWGIYCVRLTELAWLSNNTLDYNSWIYIDTGNGDTFYAMDDASYTWAEWQALPASPDPNSINQNPVFVTDYTDLHLQVGSPCNNAGENVGVTDDYDGVTRGDPPDIGAYELVGGSASASASASASPSASLSPSA